MVTILGEQGLAHAQDILATQGRIRYLKDWDTEITDRLKQVTFKPGSEPVIERFDSASNQTRAYRLTVSRVDAGKSRRFDYAKLKQAEPTLYQRFVTVSLPDAPLTLTFPKAAVWNELRSVGWQAAFEEWEEQKANAQMNLPTTAEYLSNVRAELRDLASREKVERIALAELIVTLDRQIRPYTHRDGLIRVSQSGLRQSIDLDSAERHPVLAKYVARSETKAFTKVWFQKIKNEDDGEFDL